MSIRLMTQLWDNADPALSGSRLVIMLCLADHANDDGECWPSIDRLAKRARLHRQNVMVHLKELEDAGYITVKRILGRHNSYIVHATSNDIVTGNDNTTGNATVTTTSNATVTRPVTPPLPESSSNHQSNHQVKRERPPSPSLSESASSGRERAARLTRLNGQVAAALRTPLADALLDVTGKRVLADSNTPAGDRLLQDAHEAAAVLYQMGVKSESDILALEPAWREDWRGLSGGTFKQFLEFASEQRAGKHNGRPRPGNGKRAEPESNQDKLARVYAEMDAERVANGN